MNPSATALLGRPTTLMKNNLPSLLSREQVLFFGFIIFLSFLLGHFQIWEQDIFWMLRDGQYIADNLKIPKTEMWSYTANGSFVQNYYPLSSLIVHLIEALSGLAGLVYLRVFCVGLVLVLTNLIFTQFANLAFLYRSIFLIIFGVALSPTIQLRGDFFNIILFLAFLNIWQRPSFKIIGLTIFLILSSALHLALFPFSAFLTSLVILSDGQNLRGKLKYLLTCVIVSLFCINWSQLLENINLPLSKISPIPNPDFRAFTLNQFFPSFEGIGWPILTTLCILGFIYSFQKSWISKNWIKLIGLLILAVMSYRVARTQYYFLLFLLPDLVDGLQKSSEFRFLKTSSLVSLNFAVFFALAPYDYFSGRLLWGTRVDERYYPVKSAEFVRETQPVKNIFHTPTFGAYFVYALPNYPVMFDTRQFPFKVIDQELFEAQHDPARLDSYFTKWNINTVIMPNIRMALHSDGSVWDRMEELYPSTKWALVYFDDHEFVALRRIPEHEPLIKAREYKMLKPNLPPEAVILKYAPQKSALIQEAERCVKESHAQLCQLYLAELQPN